MLQETIPSIRTISAKATALCCEIDDAIEQQEPDQENVKRLLEKWRKFLGVQGARALWAARNWAKGKLEARLPEAFTPELDAAIKLLTEHKFEGAHWKIVGAAKLLVRDVDYASLSVQEVAVMTCLISDLMQYSDAFIAYRSHEPTGHHRGEVADHAVELAAKQDGRIEDFVSLLAEVFCDFGAELGDPKDASVSGLQSLLTNDIESANLPGVFLAIWAVTHGHLSYLNDSIQEAVAALVAKRTTSLNQEAQRHQLEG